ncbi:MAG: transporter substrate-binding domain-containing protein, partial [Treponema sp.]|nr:transporter substrate-binding domain-containing protein [Treponema sp.]
MIKKNRIVISLVSAVVLIFVLSCTKDTGSQATLNSTVSPFGSFRNIPTVTDKEIAAIEALQKDYEYFIYGMTPSTEAFLDRYGNINGFSALFCEWLTELFDIPFIPEHIAFSDFLAKLGSFEVSFTGDITPTDERRKVFFMTDDIATRSVCQFRIAGSEPLSEIEKSRPLRYAFVEGTSTIDDVTSRLEPGTYEVMFINNIDDIYNALISGEIDAFLNECTQEISFDSYGNVYAEDFLPLIFSPVSMTTANPALEPIISVVSKALHNGADPYLNNLYNQGYEAYRKNRFIMHLNEEEKAYLQNHSVIPFATQYSSYPLSFFNTYEEKWEGIVFDLLHELNRLTGINFELINDQRTTIPELVALLESGKAYLMPQLILTPEREGLFIWLEGIYAADKYALLSKWSFPNIGVNDIPNETIGLIKGTAFTEIFQKWFPNAANITEYATEGDAFLALDRGEVNLVMSGQHRLITMTNYYNLSDYKVNFLFNHSYEPYFAFNKDQAVLGSIIGKAFLLIDTNVIVQQWMSKTYNYHAQLLAAQRPWLIGAIVLSLAVLVLVLVLFFRSRNESKRLVKHQAELEAANNAKSGFLARVSHEIRTPMNAIIGITEIQLQNEKLLPEVKEALDMIYHSGYLLLGIINDILDLSKIEAGKLELSP